MFLTFPFHLSQCLVVPQFLVFLTVKCHLSLAHGITWFSICQCTFRKNFTFQLLFNKLNLIKFIAGNARQSQFNDLSNCYKTQIFLRVCGREYIYNQIFLTVFWREYIYNFTHFLALPHTVFAFCLTPLSLPLPAFFSFLDSVRVFC